MLGGPSSVNGYIPHTRTFTLVGGVTGRINVTTTSDTATINITIQVPDPTGYSTHFDTVRTATTISRMGRQTFSAVRYEISNRVVRINGQSLFAAGPFLAVRTIPSTGSFSYMGSAGVYQLGTGSGVATFSGYPTYYYVSPFGHLYRYSGTKAVRDKAPGKVFVRRNPTQNEQLIITSENNFITQELSKLSGAAMSIEPVGGGAAIGLNFRNTGTNAFMITSSTSVNTNVSPTSYTGTTLMVGSMTFNNIETVLLAGEGFERYRSASNEATAFVDYDSFFINGRNAVFSTSPRVTAIVREGQMFLAGGGTAQATYTVEGNRVKYAGVTVFTLNSGFTSRDISGPGLISYDGQAFTGSATNRGIESFAYNVGTTNGMAFNGDATVSIAPGTNVRLYVSGSEAFATSSQSLISNITAASTPTTIPGSNAMYTTVLGSGNTGILQLNGQNVVSFTGSAMSLTLNNGDAVSYSGGSITLTPANSRGPFNSISRLTYAPTGQDIRQYNPIASETFSVDSSYQLVVDGSGNALLTNDGTVKGLLSNPQFGITFSNRDGQGNFHLMIGGNNIERMGRNTARHIIPAGGSLRLVGPSLAGIINGNAIFPGVTTTSVQTYFSDDTVPTTIRGSPQPYVRSANTPFYVYITGSTAFITDRATVDAAINNQLMEPSSSTPTQTSTPSPTPTPTPSTTAPPPPVTTAPPPPVTTGGISVVVRNDENGNPIVRSFDRTTGTDTNQISLTGSTLRNITAGQTIEYNRPSLFITESGGQRERLSDNIAMCKYYRDGELQTFFLSAMTTASKDGLLVVNEISRTAFFTDDPETIDMIRSANPPTTFSGGITTTTDGSNVLTIGGSETHPITEETTLSVSSVQTVRVSDSGYSVINQDGSIAFSSSGQMFNTLVQYLNSSDQVNVSSLTSTLVEFQGPQTISVSSDSIIVSNRPEVNNAIQSVIPTPSLTVGTRVDDNNNMILVIGGRDVIVMDDALVRRIESYEFITYSNSMVSVTNVVTNGMSGSNISSSRFTMYTPSNDAPMAFTGSAPSTPFGPGLLYYTANESFFVSRPDVAATIFSMFNVSSTLPPPPATMTPIPGTTFPPPGNPDSAFVLNSDGSSWDPQTYTQVS